MKTHDPVNRPAHYTDGKIEGEFGKTTLEGSLLVMREIGRIRYLEEFERMAPALVVELRAAGVKFPGD